LIPLDKKDRSRQGSVWVGDNEYLIHTEFYIWIAFGKKLESLGDNGFQIEELKPYFKIMSVDGKEYGLPEDWNQAYEELVKFYANKQPLPRDTEKEYKKLVDWDADSERIYCAFLERYNINLITADLHWHDFLALYYNLFWPLIEVVSARQYEKPKEMKPKEEAAERHRIKSQNKYMWELEAEKKETFKMR